MKLKELRSAWEDQADDEYVIKVSGRSFDPDVVVYYRGTGDLTKDTQADIHQDRLIFTVDRAAAFRFDKEKAQKFAAGLRDIYHGKRIYYETKGGSWDCTWNSTLTHKFEVEQVHR